MFIFRDLKSHRSGRKGSQNKVECVTRTSKPINECGIRSCRPECVQSLANIKVRNTKNIFLDYLKTYTHAQIHIFILVGREI